MPLSPRGTFVVHWLPSHDGEVIPPANVTELCWSCRLNSDDLNATSNAVAPHVRVAQAGFILQVCFTVSYVQHSVDAHGKNTESKEYE